MLVVIAYGMTRDDWLQGFLAGITIAMAVLPEEFPVVLPIFLALGRMENFPERRPDQARPDSGDTGFGNSSMC